VLVTYPRRVVDVPGLLRLIGQAVGAADRGEAAAVELETVLSVCPPAPAERRTFCPIWKNPWMTFNAETFADDLLRRVGGGNIFGGRPERYFEIGLEEVAAGHPEVILLPDEPYVFGRKDLPALAPLAKTPALRGPNLHFVDGKALFWFGTRTAAALPYLRTVLERAY
jgi:ABC-type hemin transport system substrate-binding protein